MVVDCFECSGMPYSKPNSSEEPCHACEATGQRDLTFKDARALYPEVSGKPKSWERSFFKENSLIETAELLNSALAGDIEAFCEAFCWRTCPGHINWWMDKVDSWHNTGHISASLIGPIKEAREFVYSELKNENN